MQSHHIIKSQILNLQTNFEEDIYQFQDNAAFIMKHIAPDIINRILNKHSIPYTIIKFDSLELDLGDIEHHYFKIQFIERLERALDKLLTQKISDWSLSYSKARQQIEFIPHQHRQIEILKLFLEKGYLPWNNTISYFDAPLFIIDELLITKPNLLIEILKKYAHQPSTIKRIQAQLTSFQFQQIIRLLSRFAYLSINNITQVYLTNSLDNQTNAQMHQVIDQFTLMYLLQHPTFHRSRFIQQLEQHLLSIPLPIPLPSYNTQEMKDDALHYHHVIQFFLKYGTLPPQAAHWTLDLLEQHFLEQLQYDIIRFKQLFLGLSPDIPFVKRLVSQFKTSTIQQLITVLSGEKYEDLAPLIRQLTNKKLSIDNLSVEYKYLHLSYEGLIHYLIFENQEVSSEAFKEHFLSYLQKFTILSTTTIQTISNQMEQTLSNEATINHLDIFEEWLKYGFLPNYYSLSIVELFQFLQLEYWEGLVQLLNKYQKKEATFVRLIQQLPQKVLYDFFDRFTISSGISTTSYIQYLIQKLKTFPQTSFQVHLAFFKAITHLTQDTFIHLKRNVSSQLIQVYRINQPEQVQKIFQQHLDEDSSDLSELSLIEYIRHFLKYGIWLNLHNETFYQAWQKAIQTNTSELVITLFTLPSETISYRLAHQLTLSDLDELLHILRPDLTEIPFLLSNQNKTLGNSTHQKSLQLIIYQVTIEYVLADKEKRTNNEAFKIWWINTIQNIVKNYSKALNNNKLSSVAIIRQFLLSGNYSQEIESDQILKEMIKEIINSSPEQFHLWLAEIPSIQFPLLLSDEIIKILIEANFQQANFIVKFQKLVEKWITSTLEYPNPRIESWSIILQLLIHQRRSHVDETIFIMTVLVKVAQQSKTQLSSIYQSFIQYVNNTSSTYFKNIAQLLEIEWSYWQSLQLTTQHLPEKEGLIPAPSIYQKEDISTFYEWSNSTLFDWIKSNTTPILEKVFVHLYPTHGVLILAIRATVDLTELKINKTQQWYPLFAFIQKKQHSEPIDLLRYWIEDLSLQVLKTPEEIASILFKIGKKTWPKHQATTFAQLVILEKIIHFYQKNTLKEINTNGNQPLFQLQYYLEQQILPSHFDKNQMENLFIELITTQKEKVLQLTDFRVSAILFSKTILKKSITILLPDYQGFIINLVQLIEEWQPLSKDIIWTSIFISIQKHHQRFEVKDFTVNTFENISQKSGISFSQIVQELYSIAQEEIINGKNSYFPIVIILEQLLPSNNSFTTPLIKTTSLEKDILQRWLSTGTFEVNTSFSSTKSLISFFDNKIAQVVEVLKRIRSRSAVQHLIHFTPSNWWSEIILQLTEQPLTFIPLFIQATQETIKNYQISVSSQIITHTIWENSIFELLIRPHLSSIDLFKRILPQVSQVLHISTDDFSFYLLHIIHKKQQEKDNCYQPLFKLIYTYNNQLKTSHATSPNLISKEGFISFLQNSNQNTAFVSRLKHLIQNRPIIIKAILIDTLQHSRHIKLLIQLEPNIFYLLLKLLLPFDQLHIKSTLISLSNFIPLQVIKENLLIYLRKYHSSSLDLHLFIQFLFQQQTTSPHQYNDLIKKSQKYIQQHISEIHPDIQKALNQLVKEEDKKEKERTQEETINHDIYVNNAGLVLIWPFITHLFKMLEYTEHNQFKNNALQKRAIHLLQFIMSETTDTPEYELVLNKLLCGIPISEPVPREIDISTKEIETCLELLEVVLNQWTDLKSLTVDNFRGSFLRRKGVLFKKDKKWKLQVEKATYDILMKSLPWGISMIKLPWMEQSLFVEWEY